MVEPPPLCRFERVLHPPDSFVPSIDYIMLTDCGEPSYNKEAMQVANSKKWQLAMQLEMQVCIRIKHGIWLSYHKASKLYLVNGFTRIRLLLMMDNQSTKHG